MKAADFVPARASDAIHDLTSRYNEAGLKDEHGRLGRLASDPRMVSVYRLLEALEADQWSAYLNLAAVLPAFTARHLQEQLRFANRDRKAAARHSRQLADSIERLDGRLDTPPGWLLNILDLLQLVPDHKSSDPAGWRIYWERVVPPEFLDVGSRPTAGEARAPGERYMASKAAGVIPPLGAILRTFADQLDSFEPESHVDRRFRAMVESRKLHEPLAFLRLFQYQLIENGFPMPETVTPGMAEAMAITAEVALDWPEPVDPDSARKALNSPLSLKPAKAEAGPHHPVTYRESIAGNHITIVIEPLEDSGD